MESSLINGIKFIWSYSIVKIYFFHWNQSLEKQRKKYKHLLDDNISNQESFKSLLTLPLIKLDMVELIFNQLRIKNQDLEYYYENIFIKNFHRKCGIIIT